MVPKTIWNSWLITDTVIYLKLLLLKLVLLVTELYGVCYTFLGWVTEKIVYFLGQILLHIKICCVFVTKSYLFIDSGEDYAVASYTG